MSLRKAAEMALEALNDDPKMLDDWLDNLKTAREALRQALAQPEQEPVGYVTIENISSWAQVPSIKWFKKPTQGPLYTAPPKREWVEITKGECDELFRAASDHIEYAYAIEAKLKEKNT